MNYSVKSNNVITQIVYLHNIWNSCIIMVKLFERIKTRNMLLLIRAGAKAR